MRYISLLLLIFTGGLVSCQTSSTGTKLDPAEFDAKIKATENPQIIDVRTPGEFSSGFISGAVNLDYNSGDFSNKAGTLDKSKTYFVYCLSGGRSSSAASEMRNSGFTNVYELSGGIMAWRKANLPLSNAATATDAISAEQYKTMTSDSLVLVDFFALWCGPCKKMEPDINAIGQEYAGKIKVYRVDVDQNKNLALQMNITQIPVVKIYKSGKESWSNTGYTGKAEMLKAAGLVK